MSLSQENLKAKLNQLECHFTWELNKDDVDIQNLLNRLGEGVELDLGKEQGVARAHNFSGYVKFLLGDQKEALSHLLESEALFGDHCDKLLIVTYGNFAWVNYHMENYTECEGYLQKIQEINEKFLTESVPEVLGEKEWTFLKFSRKYYERARDVFKKAVEMDPDNSEWNAGYAIALYRTDTEPCTVDSPAVKQLRQALDIDPDDDVLKVHLGLKLLFCSKQLMKDSEKLVEEALNGSPDHPHVMRYVSMFFRDRGSVERSIELLKKALQNSPGSSFIHHQLALCYRSKKINLQKEKQDSEEVNEARDNSIYHLEMATSLKASFIIAMSELALQYGERGDLHMAENLFEETFKIATEKKDNLKAVHFHYAQYQQYSIRNEEQAIYHYIECLKTAPLSSEGTRSVHKLKKIAQNILRKNPDDWNGSKIIGLIFQERPDMCQDNPNASTEEADEVRNNLNEIMFF
ncbi:interferon-induced protein with tetratricopeptide repeats 5-like [Paramisgurnus dabryanus]|uniref:interferon-induced protein with tetratricopeptide repeats 5-like n=1 Tax=Paramisgurnus dabryanus TaxID=90735 RepID=UPI0031F3EDE0